jgi:hypothetical protein
LALTFIVGEAAKWAATYGEELFVVINGDPANNLAPTHANMDEALWTNFCLRLRTRFSEYHGSQSTSQALVTLKQEAGHIEDYCTLMSLTAGSAKQDGTTMPIAPSKPSKKAW